jgi:hypothetical protein
MCEGVRKSGNQESRNCLETVKKIPERKVTV